MVKILVPLDFSEFSIPTIEAAVKMAQSGDEVVLFTSIQRQGISMNLPSTGLTASLGVDPDFRAIEQYMDAESRSEDSMDKLKAYEEIAARKPGIKITKVVKIGDPREEILKAADELHVDQIVMGSRGLNVISKMFLGSVSDHVVKNASCDVTIVKKPKHKAVQAEEKILNSKEHAI